MRLYPAIDLIEGQAVRLVKGDFERQTSYGDPLEVAHKYATAGATHLHVVDLDAAKNGQTSASTERIVARIMTATGLTVEIGGGIRSEGDVSRWLNVGVWRCVIGTRAAEEPEFARRMRETFGDAVIVGIDAKGDRVATRGWLEDSSWTTEEFAKELYKMGYRECIYTDISRDGMLQGANIAASLRLASASGLNVVVSGGVSTLDDVQALLAGASQGITGAIIGKALLSGRLDLRVALAALQGGGK